MKSITMICASAMTLLMAATTAVNGLADCSAFNNTCSCPSGKTANPMCGPLSASCTCTGAFSDNLNDGKQFCAKQRDNCQNNVCNGQILDSFSCDPFSFNSQCMCRSQSQQRGGPALSGNDTTCVALMDKCKNQLCAGKKVVMNQCVVPQTAMCQCEGEAARSTNAAVKAMVGSAGLATGAVAAVMMLL